MSSKKLNKNNDKEQQNDNRRDSNISDNKQQQQDENNENQPLNSQRLPTNLNGYIKPTYFYCKNCERANVSDVNISPNSNTWVACIFFSTFCCCCLPFFLKDCNSIHHYCSVCNLNVGFTK